jgi:hypothetical protein
LVSKGGKTSRKEKERRKGSERILIEKKEEDG